MFRFKAMVESDLKALGMFQYILCFGSSIKLRTDLIYKMKFQYILCFGSSMRECKITVKSIYVSIHPMFRFKTNRQSKNFIYNNVSIHPMFRFKATPAKKLLQGGVAFQYILCFGSSQLVVLLEIVFLSFNTSYVSVQALDGLNVHGAVIEFQYILCFGSRKIGIAGFSYEKKVSIHPMFRFKGFCRCYFDCSYIVSIHPMFRFKLNRQPLRI